MTFQVSKKEGFELRSTYLGKTRRVVVKVGSAVLTGEDGLNLKVMENLASEISFLLNSGKEVILVSSGAVAAGRKRLELSPEAGNPEHLGHDYGKYYSNEINGENDIACISRKEGPGKQYIYRQPGTAAAESVYMHGYKTVLLVLQYA